MERAGAGSGSGSGSGSGTVAVHSQSLERALGRAPESGTRTLTAADAGLVTENDGDLGGSRCQPPIRAFNDHALSHGELTRLGASEKTKTRPPPLDSSDVVSLAVIRHVSSAQRRGEYVPHGTGAYPRLLTARARPPLCPYQLAGRDSQLRWSIRRGGNNLSLSSSTKEIGSD
ncbi:hypothetical protein CCHR01_13571 [Colletotrichum chrysophilum]|uniref:Uncharacterized protein n=1 Tax=Colletotrichum chrysophilum TaxID=1836956 RepID=A0AAD9ED15_9PEZI|nr:hypothetical protein CCHR01_13571 [Colletotrichum chrysophilum]